MITISMVCSVLSLVALSYHLYLLIGIFKRNRAMMSLHFALGRKVFAWYDMLRKHINPQHHPDKVPMHEITQDIMNTMRHMANETNEIYGFNKPKGGPRWLKKILPSKT